MPSKTDFNVSPYYDDFSEAKKFHRVMYRPAFAVQARELTTQQSICKIKLKNLVTICSNMVHGYSWSNYRLSF